MGRKEKYGTLVRLHSPTKSRIRSAGGILAQKIQPLAHLVQQTFQPGRRRALRHANGEQE
nr:hypothetical protein [Candidatus Sodalis endolongispinus]